MVIRPRLPAGDILAGLADRLDAELAAWRRVVEDLDAQILVALAGLRPGRAENDTRNTP